MSKQKKLWRELDNIKRKMPKNSKREIPEIPNDPRARSLGTDIIAYIRTNNLDPVSWKKDPKLQAMIKELMEYL